MNDIIEAVSNAVFDRCHVHDCNRDGCSISVNTAASRKVVIDLDCAELRIPSGQKRCDHVFIGEKNRKSWIVPIELKSGGFDAAVVVGQLQGGADVAEKWLPPEVDFLFLPVLVHGTRGVSRKQDAEFRSTKVKMRGRTKQVVVRRCGDRLKDVLDANA